MTLRDSLGKKALLIIINICNIFFSLLSFELINLN